MTTELTPRQRSVLAFIVQFQQEHLMAPTVREIGAHFGLRSPAGVHRILTVLRDKGYLLAEQGKKRNWRFSREVSGRGLPLLGTIAAGDPLEAVENLEAVLAVSPDVFGEGCFAVRVRGDSMIEAHILDGDLAVIRPQARVDNGAIAAVMVQGLLDEATLKIVHRTRSALRLEPANGAYEPLVFRGPQRGKVRILGRFVGILRRV